MAAKKKIAATAPEAPATRVRWPWWRFVALLGMLLSVYPLAQAVERVVEGKLGERLTLEMGPGLIVPGDSPGTLGDSIAACMAPDGTVLHLSRNGQKLRMQRFDAGLKLIREREWQSPEAPVGLGQADGALWVFSQSGKVARLNDDLRPGPFQPGPFNAMRCALPLPGGRAVGIEAGGGRLLIWRRGETDGVEPMPGRIIVALNLAASSDGRVAVIEMHQGALLLHVLDAQGAWARSFDALDLHPSVDSRVAWADSSDLVVNDAQGPRGLLLFDADSGTYLGQAVQSRQHDHLFNVAFIAGAPDLHAFLVRTTNGISWGRFTRPRPALWSPKASTKGGL